MKQSRVLLRGEVVPKQKEQENNKQASVQTQVASSRVFRYYTSPIMHLAS